MSSHAALTLSPRRNARIPKAAAPSTATPAHSRTDARRRMALKLRLALPMFKSCHRFGSLGPLLVVAVRAGGARLRTGESDADRRPPRAAGRRRAAVGPRGGGDGRGHRAGPRGLPRVRPT